MLNCFPKLLANDGKTINARHNNNDKTYNNTQYRFLPV